MYRPSPTGFLYPCKLNIGCVLKILQLTERRSGVGKKTRAPRLKNRTFVPVEGVGVGVNPIPEHVTFFHLR